MNAIHAIGITLMLVGILGMVWGTLDYLKNRQTLDLGDHTLVLRDKDLPPQALGGLALFAVGIVLTFATDDDRRVRHA